MKKIHKEKTVVIEGKLRCAELKDHLLKYKSANNSTDMAVFLSEDASGIVARLKYDGKTDQIVGLLLPMDKGMPISMSFTPSKEEEIENLMKMEKSTLVYIMVVQPLTPSTPSFILQIFGTNNKFTTIDVLDRWAHVSQELERYKVEYTNQMSSTLAITFRLSRARSRISIYQIEKWQC